jgi:hypothetical protein
MKLHFHLPVYALWPLILIVAAAAAFLYLFDALRYITCEPWTRLPSSPRPGAQLLAAFSNKIYINDDSGGVYCYAHGGWNRCTYPTFNTLSKDQPGWEIRYLQPPSIQEPLIDLHRNDNIVAIDYFALTGSGTIYQCATNFQDETTRIVLAPSGLILLVPAIILVIAVTWFVRIAVVSGQPKYTTWDGDDRDY